MGWPELVLRGKQSWKANLFLGPKFQSFAQTGRNAGEWANPCRAAPIYAMNTVRASSHGDRQKRPDVAGGSRPWELQESYGILRRHHFHKHLSKVLSLTAPLLGGHWERLRHPPHGKVSIRQEVWCQSVEVTAIQNCPGILAVPMELWGWDEDVQMPSCNAQGLMCSISVTASHPSLADPDVQCVCVTEQHSQGQQFPMQWISAGEQAISLKKGSSKDVLNIMQP